MRSPNEALALVRAFDASPEEEKSRELVLTLLDFTSQPFSRHQFLLMHHHRHKRWLLPGGHVEECDVTMGDTARREAIEETAVRIGGAQETRLVGVDVHGIPARKGEPFHLHHDLIFVFSADSEEFALTDEAPRVAWCGAEECAHYQLPGNIIRAAQRSLLK